MRPACNHGAWAVNSAPSRTPARRYRRPRTLVSSGFAYTVRFGAGLGYDEMHAALEVNIPNYATAILSAEETVEAISESKG